MGDPGTPRALLLRFGPYEVDLRAGELRKHGVRIKLREQPFQILTMLLEQPGEVVLREEIRLRLWPNNTVVEFDHSINAAIQKLRDALSESADQPRYVETVARRGYRFLGTVEGVGGREEKAAPATPAEPAEPAPGVLSEPGDLSGRTVSHYRILSKLGAGGMGVVYQAEDLTLGRRVALKVLPMAADEVTPSILRRFEREAQAASTLNHPNICTVYGFEKFGEQPVIAMELVEGETLECRLARSPLPAEQAIRLALQIAGALAEAHGKGVVHRDLKPANIMLTKSGAKVLDFGLAKILRTPAAADQTTTMAGTIQGTLHYMSPEQARGEDVDARSDIFSFGVVLFEMFAGKRPFEGKSGADITAAILNQEPPSLAPIALERVVRRCLAKDVEERWQSARDLAAALAWVVDSAAADRQPAPLPGRAAGSRLRWIGGGMIAALSIALVVLLSRPKAVEVPLTRFTITAPENFVFGGMPGPAVSPDGRQIVFGAILKAGGYQLFLRSLGQPVSQALAGTEGGEFPFWSPDGKSLGFFAGNKLKKLDLNVPSSPGQAVNLCDAPAHAGGTWNRDGVIVFSTSGVLYRIRDTGGSPVPIGNNNLLNQDPKGSNYGFPWFLPDGRHFLFETVGPLDPDRVSILAGSLDSGEESRFILKADSNAIFLHGYLLYKLGTALMASPFNPRRRVLIGEPLTVTDELASGNSGRFAGIGGSEEGLLVYRSGASLSREIAWFDRNGKRLSAIGEVASFNPHSLEFSPDQRTFALGIEEQGNTDIWMYNTARGLRTRFTFDHGIELHAIWSPDGRMVVFNSNRKGPYDLYRRSADGNGAEELLYADDADKGATSWSPDGRFLLYTRNKGMVQFGSFRRVFEIWVLPLTNDANHPTAKPFAFVQQPESASEGRFSPDGQWVAYQSSESGQSEIYVAPFRASGGAAGGKRQISTTGGVYPRWGRNGKEIFYVAGRRLMTTAIEIKDRAVQLGETQQILGPLSIQAYDVSSDGQRFLVVAQNPQLPSQPLTVVQNWTAGLKR